MKFAGKTETGLRSQNEDSYMLLHTDGLDAVAVSDGMGGHQAGEVASSLAIETLRELLLNSRESREAVLSSAFIEANHVVHQKASAADEMHGMGCTLVAASMDAHEFTAANVGDSRLYYFDGESIRQITHDHSYVAELVRRGVITPKEAKTHPQRNLITRAIGTDKRILADIFTCEWSAGDMLLLCSDGLCGVMNEDEMATFLKSGEDLDDICAKMIDRALALGSRDNITVVLVQNDGGIA